MKRCRDEAGAALVEYALTAVLFCMFLIFILDGSRILWNYVTVTYAVRAGARYGITHGARSAAPVSPGHDAALRQVVRDAAPGLDPAQMTIDVDWSPDNTPGSRISVAITYRTGGITSLFWAGQMLTLRGTSSMIIEN